MEKYTALSLSREVTFLLKNDFPPQELQSLQKIIFEKKLGLPLHKLYLAPSLPIDPKDVEIILDIVSQLNYKSLFNIYSVKPIFLD